MLRSDRVAPRLSFSRSFQVTLYWRVCLRFHLEVSFFFLVAECGRGGGDFSRDLPGATTGRRPLCLLERWLIEEYECR